MRAPQLSPGAIWIVLVALALARIVVMFDRSMWAWGINAPRFLPAAGGWIAIGSLVLALLPPAASALTPTLDRLGDVLVRRRIAWLVAAAGAALLVWLMVDRLWFLGDFMLRQGAIQGESMATMFQQALPLDRLLHGLWPRLLPSDSLDGSVFSRLIGATEAAAMAALAVRFARDLELSGAAAVAAAGLVFFGGHLALFTGFAKATSEMALLSVATVVLGASLARGGRGGYALGIVVALAFALHRSSLILIPPWLISCYTWFRHRRAGRNWMGALVAIVLPAMMLARALPEMIRIARAFDLPRHVLTPEVAVAGGPLLAVFAPMRLIDMANLMIALAPAGLLGLLWLASGARRSSVELTLVLATLLASLPILLFVHPQQGIFRDWDVFAPVGAMLCMLSAIALGRTIQDHRADWLAAPVLASAIVPTLTVLVLHHDLDRGLERVRAYATEPPARPSFEQASLWDFLGTRSFRLERWNSAAAAFSHCDRFEPSRRIRLTWALCETMRKNYGGAAALYRKLLQRDPGDPVAWVGLAGASERLGDRATLGQATERVRQAMGVEASAREIRAYLREYPEVWATGSAQAVVAR